MDNKKPELPPDKMQRSPNQNSGPQSSAAFTQEINSLPPQSPLKNIQPTKTFIEETKAEGNKATVTTNDRPTTSRSPQAISQSIYPNPADTTAPSTAPTNPNSDSNPHTKSSTITTLVTIGVIVLGLFIAAPALLSLIGFARIISYGGIGILSNRGTAVYIIDVIYLIVGIGLILRKELARISYVVIGVLFLILSVYATISYFGKTHHISAKAEFYAIQVSSAQQSVKFDEKIINSYQNNSGISLTQKQQVIAQLEANLSKDQKSLQEAKQLQKQNSGILDNSLVQLIPGYLLAIIPLVFLTRSKVKEVFN